MLDRRLTTALGLTAVCLGLTLVVAAVAPAATAAAAQDARIDAEVRAALDRFVGAVNGADWEAAIDCYAADPRFLWIEDGQVRYRSREEVAEAYRGLGEVFAEFEIRLEDVRVQPLAADSAAVALIFHQVMVTSNGTRLELDGAILATVIERDGVWRFLLGHTSSRRAGPGTAEGAPGE